MEENLNLRNFVKPLEIKGLTLSNNIFLAPMAGGSEMPFRIICRKFGAALCFTELSTARGIRYQKSVERNMKYLEISNEELPVAIQLFGPDPLDFGRAIDIIFSHELLSKASLLDINMGCPVPKVTKGGSGSALMKDLSRASDIIKTSVKYSPVPVTVKFRKGWDQSNTNAVEFAKMCQNSGASMITVHGRFATQMYSGKADWDIIRQVKENVDIPVIGNGDIVDGESARKMFSETGVDGIMIGRAALGNPWIFSEVLSYLHSRNTVEFKKPDTQEKIMIMEEQLSRMIGQMGEKTAVKEMRKHFAWYLKGVPNSNRIKSELMTCQNQRDAITLLHSLLV